MRHRSWTGSEVLNSVFSSSGPTVLLEALRAAQDEMALLGRFVSQLSLELTEGPVPHQESQAQNGVFPNQPLGFFASRWHTTLVWVRPISRLIFCQRLDLYCCRVSFLFKRWKRVRT